MMQPSIQSFIAGRIGSLQVEPVPSLISVDDWKQATRTGFMGLLRLPKTSRVDKALGDYNARSEAFNAGVQQWNARGSLDYLERLTGSIDSRGFQRGTDRGRDALDAQFDGVRRAYNELQTVVGRMPSPENVWLHEFQRTVRQTAQQIQNTATSLAQGRVAMQTAASESIDLMLGPDGRSNTPERTDDAVPRSRFSADSIDITRRNLAALMGRESPDQEQAPPSGVLGLEAAGRQDGRVYSFSIDGGDSPRSSMSSPSPQHRSDRPQSDAAPAAEPRARSGERRSAEQTPQASPRSSLGGKPLGRFRG